MGFSSNEIESISHSCYMKNTYLLLCVINDILNISECEFDLRIAIACHVVPFKTIIMIIIIVLL